MTGHDSPHDEPATQTVSQTENGDAPELVTKTDELPRIGPLRGTLIAICIGILIFLQAINISMMTTIGSAIVRDLDAYSSVSWLTSSYMIAVSSITPMGGKLAKIFSSPVCLLFASALFSIGAAVTAASPSFLVFLVGRAIAGVAGALVFGVASVLVLEMVSQKRRGLFIGLVNSGYTVGVASGAVIAGSLEARIGWRAIIWLQIPFTVPAGLGLYFLTPRAHDASLDGPQSLSSGLKRVDYLGVITMTSAIVLLLYSLSAEKINYAMLIGSLVVFGLFMVVESQLAKEPIVPFQIFQSRPIMLTCLATQIYMMSRWTVLFFTPVYSIAVRGWSPGVSGLILIPTNAGFGLGGIIVGLVHIRRTSSYYLATLTCFVLFSASMLVFSRISTPHPMDGLYVLVTFINGFLTGCALNYSYAHLLYQSEAKLHPMVTSLIAMFRTLGGSFGSSIGGGIFGRALKGSLEAGFEGEGQDQLINQLLGSPALARSLQGHEREVARDSYATATSTLFLAAFGLVIIATIVQAGVGWTAAEGEEEDETRPLLQSEE